jgi:tetratricopeptide (TPR) repeat protein
MYRALIFSVLASPVVAQTCPMADVQPEARAEIIAQIQGSGSEMQARVHSQELWQIWLNAPDEMAQDLLDQGMQARESYNYEVAERALTELIIYCPDYAEGWNQRAFVYFLTRDYEAALADLDRAIELLPDHVAALSGKALTLIGMGMQAEAQVVLREALVLNPWLSERALLEEAPGEDI